MIIKCKQKAQNRQYIVGRNYFVKNTTDTIGVLKITNKEVFESIFGMATTMGTIGKPTTIDFNTEFAIAIISPSIDSSRVYTPLSLTKEDNSLLFNYTTETSEKLSYTIKPFLLLIVDKKYNGNLVINDGNKI